MKKLFTGICAAALIFSLSVSSAFAAGPRCGRNNACKTPASITQACKAECNYVDDDNDGICDNRQSGSNTCSGRYNFVDEDGDGICDNQGTSGCTGNGTGVNAQRKCGRNRR